MGRKRGDGGEWGEVFPNFYRGASFTIKLTRVSSIPIPPQPWGSWAPWARGWCPWGSGLREVGTGVPKCHSKAWGHGLS